jgi:hypothetical protein
MMQTIIGIVGCVREAPARAGFYGLGPRKSEQRQA